MIGSPAQKTAGSYTVGGLQVEFSSLSASLRVISVSWMPDGSAAWQPGWSCAGRKCDPNFYESVSKYKQYNCVRIFKNLSDINIDPQTLTELMHLRTSSFHTAVTFPPSSIVRHRCVWDHCTILAWSLVFIAQTTRCVPLLIYPGPLSLSNLRSRELWTIT